MSKWLFKRLAALFAAVVLLGGANYLRAQNDYPAPAKTPEEAAQMFYAALNAGTSENLPYYSYGRDWKSVEQAISRPQFQNLVENSVPYREAIFWQKLAFQAKQKTYETEPSRTVNGQIRVPISNQIVTKKREVAIVEEDGGYRVDVIATYGLWNNLTGRDLDKEIYNLTGYVAPELINDPVFAEVRANQERSICQSNLKQIALGIAQYVQDYDEKFPRAREWQPILQPYLKNMAFYNCPSVPTKKNGYAMNQWLSQKNEAEIRDYRRTVSVYETSNLKDNVFGPGTGRAYRHLDGWNLAFADGHVKWFKKGSEKGFVWKP